MTTRREFLGASALLLAAGPRAGKAAAARPLDILFLGGTGFIGPHQINAALARGHNVSMFNRGNNAGLYGDKVEELIGNRDERIDDGLEVLRGSRRWDVIVDNSGYVPRHVRDSVTLLGDRCDLYIFTSTRGVYDYGGGGVLDTDSPLWPAPVPATETVNGDTYGPLKAECDRIVREHLGDRAACVRPPYIVGPGDTTDRFTYWVERFYRGGDIVCPADPDFAVQWIDARDLGVFIVALAENRRGGIFNTAGPASRMSNETLMHGLRAFAVAPTTLYWPDREMLSTAGFNPLMFGSRPVSVQMDVSTAVDAGLQYHSLASTVADTHDWWQSMPAGRRTNPRNWPSAAVESAVIRQLADKRT